MKTSTGSYCSQDILTPDINNLLNGCESVSKIKQQGNKAPLHNVLGFFCLKTRKNDNVQKIAATTMVQEVLDQTRSYQNLLISTDKRELEKTDAPDVIKLFPILTMFCTLCCHRCLQHPNITILGVGRTLINFLDMTVICVFYNSDVVKRHLLMSTFIS